MSRNKIYVALALGLISAFILRAALVSSARTKGGENPPPVAEMAVNASGQIQPVKDEAAPAPGAPAVAAPVAPAAGPGAQTANQAEESDGKSVLAADGKETLGKETLPPVGEMVGARTNSVNAGQFGPPTEFLNRTSPQSNPLLNPPNPVNIGGPVVSAETR